MSESVGAALKSAREKRGLSLAQVSETTRVRSHYLQALENGDISAMPSAAQARGFLRIYAEFLGLDLETLIPAAGGASEPPPSEAEAPPEADETDTQADASAPGLFERLQARIGLGRRGQTQGEKDAAAEPEDTASSADASTSAALEAPSPGKKKAG